MHYFKSLIGVVLISLVLSQADHELTIPTLVPKEGCLYLNFKTPSFDGDKLPSEIILDLSKILEPTDIMVTPPEHPFLMYFDIKDETKCLNNLPFTRCDFDLNTKEITISHLSANRTTCSFPVKITDILEPTTRVIIKQNTNYGDINTAKTFDTPFSGFYDMHVDKKTGLNTLAPILFPDPLKDVKVRHIPRNAIGTSKYSNDNINLKPTSSVIEFSGFFSIKDSEYSPYRSLYFENNPQFLGPLFTITFDYKILKLKISKCNNLSPSMFSNNNTSDLNLPYLCTIPVTYLLEYPHPYPTPDAVLTTDFSYYPPDQSLLSPLFQVATSVSGVRDLANSDPFSVSNGSEVDKVYVISIKTTVNGVFYIHNVADDESAQIVLDPDCNDVVLSISPSTGKKTGIKKPVVALKVSNMIISDEELANGGRMIDLYIGFPAANIPVSRAIYFSYEGTDVVDEKSFTALTPIDVKFLDTEGAWRDLDTQLNNVIEDESRVMYYKLNINDYFTSYHLHISHSLEIDTERMQNTDDSHTGPDYSAANAYTWKEVDFQDTAFTQADIGLESKPLYGRSYILNLTTYNDHFEYQPSLTNEFPPSSPYTDKPAGYVLIPLKYNFEYYDAMEKTQGQSSGKPSFPHKPTLFVKGQNRTFEDLISSAYHFDTNFNKNAHVQSANLKSLREIINITLYPENDDLNSTVLGKTEVTIKLNISFDNVLTQFKDSPFFLTYDGGGDFTLDTCYLDEKIIITTSEGSTNPLCLSETSCNDSNMKHLLECKLIGPNAPLTNGKERGYVKFAITGPMGIEKKWVWEPEVVIESPLSISIDNIGYETNYNSSGLGSLYFDMTVDSEEVDQYYLLFTNTFKAKVVNCSVTDPESQDALPLHTLTYTEQPPIVNNTTSTIGQPVTYTVIGPIASIGNIDTKEEQVVCHLLLNKKYHSPLTSKVHTMFESDFNTLKSKAIEADTSLSTESYAEHSSNFTFPHNDASTVSKLLPVVTWSPSLSISINSEIEKARQLVSKAFGVDLVLVNLSLLNNTNSSEGNGWKPLAKKNDIFVSASFAFNSADPQFSEEDLQNALNQVIENGGNDLNDLSTSAIMDDIFSQCLAAGYGCGDLCAPCTGNNACTSEFDCLSGICSFGQCASLDLADNTNTAYLLGANLSFPMVALYFLLISFVFYEVVF